MLTVLLSLYWTADETIELREAQMQMWFEDIAEFDLDIIQGAIKEWRRVPSQRRPAPGDIRALCAEHQDARNAILQRRIEGPTQPEAWLVELWTDRDGNVDLDARRRALQRAKRLEANHEEQQRTGRALANEWARLNGYENFWDDAYRKGRKVSEVVAWVTANAKVKRMPLEPGEQEMSAAEKDKLRAESIRNAAE